MRIHVVLVEPEIPQNTGNIARTCAAVGAQLHLVEPLGFSVSSREVRRAGLDYWDDVSVHVHSSLETFLDIHGDKDLRLFSTKASQVYSDMPLPEGSDVFLLFGKETKGLPEDLILQRLDSAARIPMAPGARSLNLANSAAVVLYDLLRRLGFPNLTIKGSLIKEVMQ